MAEKARESSEKYCFFLGRQAAARAGVNPKIETGEGLPRPPVPCHVHRKLLDRFVWQRQPRIANVLPETPKGEDDTKSDDEIFHGFTLPKEVCIQALAFLLSKPARTVSHWRDISVFAKRASSHFSRTRNDPQD
jgi:hypothetical protein